MSSSRLAPTLFPGGLVPGLRPGWLVGLGIGLIVLGLLAWIDVVAASLASTVLIGLVLVIAGIVQVAHALAHRGGALSASLLPGLIGLCYALGGLAIINEPVTGSLVVTAFLAICLVFAGIARVAWAASHRRLGGWWVMLLSGLVAFAVGIAIDLSLPWSGLWVPGTLVAVELVVGGASALSFGLSLRRSRLA